MPLAPSTHLKPVEPEILRFKVAVFADLYRKTGGEAASRGLAEERALPEQRARGATVTRSALEPAGRLQVWNEGATRMYGRTAETMLGKHFDLLFTTEDVASGLHGVPARQHPEAAAWRASGPGRASGRSFPRASR